MSENLDSEMLAEIRADVRVIKATCKPCQKMVEDHHRAIDGNGSDGLKARVAVLESIEEKRGPASNNNAPSVITIPMPTTATTKTLVTTVLAIVLAAMGFGLGNGVSVVAPPPADATQGE